MNQLIETLAEDTAIATGAFAQSTVVPIDNEPAPRLILEPPLPGPLAQGVVFIPYRVENLRMLPVAGPAARNLSPRDLFGSNHQMEIDRVEVCGLGTVGLEHPKSFAFFGGSLTSNLPKRLY